MILTILGVLGLLGASLKGGDWPSASYWVRNADLFTLCVVLIALGSISNAWQIAHQHVRERRDDLHAKAHAPLVSLYRELLELFGAERYKDFVVTAFLVRWRISKSWPWIRRELTRVCRVGLRIRPSSTIRWTKGKGLIGACWDKGNQDVRANFSEDCAAVHNGVVLAEMDERQWNQLSAGIRYGLTRDDRDWTLANTPAIIATPIQSKGGFIGCVAVDCQPDQLETVFEHRRAREELQDAAQVIAGLVA